MRAVLSAVDLSEIPPSRSSEHDLLSGRATMKLKIMPVPTIIETNDIGELQIPARVINAGPHTRFRLEQDGNVLKLIPESSPKGWKSLTQSVRSRAFQDWAEKLPARNGPEIPDEALRRENLYD